MTGVVIRPVQASDDTQWRPLWDSYNAFYGRSGATALPEEITETTWARFFDADEVDVRQARRAVLEVVG